MGSGHRAQADLRHSDYVLLGISLILGTAATLRGFGTGEITAWSILLLSAAAIAALRPLIKLSGGGRSRAITAVIFGVHLVATLFFFPPEDVINSRPVLTLDHAVHYQQVVRANEVFRDSYRLNTYDPYFMAGYPGGTLFDIDSKGVELWCSLAAFAGTARPYKFFILAGYLLAVFTIYAGSRRLGFDGEESALSTLLLLAFWHWGRPYAGEFRFAGMFSFMIVTHLCVYIAGAFRSFLRGERAWAFWIAGPLAFLVHPTAAILLPVPFLALFLVERGAVSAGERHSRRVLGMLARFAAWCLLVIAVNAVWLIPLFRYLDMKVPSEIFFQIDGIGGLLKLLVKPGNLPALLLAALSLTGSVYLVRSGRARAIAAPAAGSLFLLIITAFGIHIPVFDQMEPGRFLVPALIFMAPLAGPGLVILLRGAKRAIPSGSIRRIARSVLLIVLLLSSPVFALLASRGYYRHTLSTTVAPEVEDLVTALRKYTDPSGRLMIEDGPAWNFGDSFFAAMIPQLTGVEQIGGPYPWTFIKHNFTNFHMCRAMGRPLEDIDPENFWRYIRLYNIRWILTSTPDCRECVEGILDRDVIWSSRHFSLWEVSAAGSLEEGGIVTRASYGRIEVKLVGGEGGVLPRRILLPYHWDRGLQVEPPAVLSKERRMDDPVPFILLEPNGKREILIEFR